MNSQKDSTTGRIPPRWVRILVLLFMLFCIGIFSIGVFVTFRYAYRYPEAFTANSWSVEAMSRLIDQVGLTFQGWINIQLALGLVTAACHCIVGGFIYARKQEDWFGLYVSAVLVFYGTLSSYQAGILTNRYPWSGGILQSLSVFSWAGWFFIFYLFPDGRFAPRWQRWVALLLLFGFVIDVVFYGGGSPPAWLAAIILLGIVGGLFSVIYRYRRVSDPLQRQQTKWVFFAILVLVSTLIFGLLTIFLPTAKNIDASNALFFPFFSVISSILINVFPLSIGFAILRYRLWDVDVIIRRTLIYSALTAILALVFFGGVTILQNLFQLISGQQSAISIVISTQAIAALFSPLRRRIQTDIDRRFYRKKYDSQKTLERFAALARNEVELEELIDHLQRVVEETIQPESVAIWLRPTKKYSQDQVD